MFYVIHDKRTGNPAWFDMMTGKFRPGLRKESIAYMWVSYKSMDPDDWKWSWITDLFDLYYEHELLRSNFGIRARRSEGLPEEYGYYELRACKGILGGMDLQRTLFGDPVLVYTKDDPELIYDDSLLKVE